MGGWDGIVPQLLRQVQPGLGGSGAQQQPPPAPQQQHHLVPGRLLNLLYAGVFHLGGGLPDHGTAGKWRPAAYYSPSIIRQNSSLTRSRRPWRYR